MSENVYAVNKRGYHHGDLRRSALELTVRIVEQDGLEKLSLRAVAQRAGVSPMALYRHFADKDALLAAVGEHGFILLHQRLAAASNGGSAQQLLTDWGVAYVGFARDHPDLFRLMFGGPPAWQSQSDRAALPDRPDTTFGMMTALMRTLFPPEELDLAMLTAWSFVHGLASLIVDRRLSPFPPDIDQLTAEVSRFFAQRLVPGGA